MTSTRPYLVRAIYEWLLDNDCTPYILVDATQPGVTVPPQVIRDGQVVLNLAPRAIDGLHLGNDHLRFRARFSGVSFEVWVPMAALLAIYAQENGQGMMFGPEEANAAGEVSSGEPARQTSAPALSSVAPASPPASGTPDPDKPDRPRPSLKLVK